MIFPKKKRDMIDLRELQKRGVVRIPKKEIIVPTNNDGFVELSNSTSDTQPSTPDTTPSNSSFFGFLDDATPSEQPDNNTRSPNADSRITDLDNKIYKLEQRIELLEKKLDVNQPANNVGAMGW